MEYIVVLAEHDEKKDGSTVRMILLEKVNKKIKEGFKPIGGVAVGSSVNYSVHTLVQAMIKE